MFLFPKAESLRRLCYRRIGSDPEAIKLVRTNFANKPRPVSRPKESGWVRFAAGFKAGVYGHSTPPFCIKVMGVGDDPSNFAGRGYYNQHERRMLEAFARHGFKFQPRVQSVEKSVVFLIEQCGVNSDQARWQCDNHHVLIVERILGVPFATATGHGLTYEPNIAIFDSTVLSESESALHKLKWLMDEANHVGLCHNDPVPANLVFERDSANKIVARLLDYELAQDFGEASPDYVGHSEAVNELAWRSNAGWRIVGATASEVFVAALFSR